MINLNLNTLQCKKPNISPSFRAGSVQIGNGPIITDIENHNMVLSPDSNRKDLLRASDKFEKTLINGPLEGDEMTVERLKDADTALTVADKLQKIAKDLYGKAQKGVQDVKDRPFDIARPKRTPVEKEIVKLGATVENRIKATQPIMIACDPEIQNLICGSQTELLNANAAKTKELEQKLASSRKTTQDIVNMAALLDSPDAESKEDLN